MISAVLYKDGDEFTGCRIQGHSGMDESGRDIVCAAASILGTTCVNSLESVCGVIPRVTENAEGILSFELPDTEGEQSRGAAILMGALRQGLSDLAEEYPEYLKLTIKKRRKSQ